MTTYAAGSPATHLAVLRWAGSELKPFGAATLLVTPGGATYRVEAAPHLLHDVLRSFDGRRPTSDVLAELPSIGGLAEVLEVLQREGVLVPAAPGGGAGDLAEPFDLVLLGEPDQVAAVRRSLEAVVQETPGADVRVLPADCRTTAELVDVAVARAAERGATPVVLCVLDQLDVDLLVELDRTCAAAAVRWTQLHAEAGAVFWGPHVVPGRTAGYRDLLARRRCAVDEAEVFDALVSPSVTGSLRLSPSAWEWALSGFVTDLLAWLAGRSCRGVSVEVEADPRTLTVTGHPVLPLPGTELTGPLLSSAPEGTGRLIDERTGIIQRTRVIRHHEDVPRRLHTVQTHNSSMGRIDPEWANDVITGGSVFDDPDAARASAIGEAVERYCGNHMGQAELRWASWQELVEAGEHAVDPADLVLYSERMYDTPGCPFVRFTRDLRVRWVRGRSLTHDRPTWLPVTLVFVNWIAAEIGKHPVTNYMNFSGVAAGAGLEHALVSGIEELVERDATMIWWMNAQPLPAVRPTPEMLALLDGLPGAGQAIRLVHLDNEFGVPVMAGIVESREGWFTIGFAARPDARTAALKALTEAFTLQEGSRDLATENSLIRQAIDWGFASYVGLKPWRADRRYLDDYRADFRDVSDLMCQQQIFLDPRAVEAVRPWTDTPAERTFDQLPALPDRSLASYRERLESRGFEICYVDLTTQDVAAAGMNAVRVLIPGLVPNFPAAFPMLGRGRVQQAAVDLGWRTEPLAEEALNYWPIPHA